MPSLKNSPRPLRKKPPAKKPWTDAPSRPSATSVKKPDPRKKLKKAPVEEVLRRLRREYPDAHCELDHQSAFQLLVATVLSAQCTDVMVNRVTPVLFKYAPTPEALAELPLEKIENMIRSIGLYKNKAKNIRSLARDLVDKHHGEVPSNLPDLVELAGVGRKTANVVLGNAFGIASGIVVDTHIGRLSRRFGWTRSEDAVQIEKELQKLIPEERWVQFSHELIFLGRRICKARNPDCPSCFLKDICPKIGVAS
ncbi:MAG: endonuclease III [Bdellovibrionaceae bacterium]|nr:endonuclease III [Pseudobdellovibrionaceae bacterium]